MSRPSPDGFSQNAPPQSAHCPLSLPPRPLASLQPSPTAVVSPGNLYFAIVSISTTAQSFCPFRSAQKSSGRPARWEREIGGDIKKKEKEIDMEIQINEKKTPRRICKSPGAGAGRRAGGENANGAGEEERAEREGRGGGALVSAGRSAARCVL